MIGQFLVRKKQYGPLALDHLSKRQMILSFSRNSQQSHIINILLASFARSVRQVMDPRGFFFIIPCFHKRRGKNSVHNLPYGPRTGLITDLYSLLAKQFHIK